MRAHTQCAFQSAAFLLQVRHHSVGTLRGHALVVIAAIVVSAIGLPMVHRDGLHCHQWLGLVLVLAGENLKPGQHSPHAILLADVVTTSAKAFLATDEGGVALGVGEILLVPRIHQVAEELPSRRSHEARNLLPGGNYTTLRTIAKSYS